MSTSEIVTLLGIAVVAVLLLWVGLRDRRARKNGTRQALSNMVGAFDDAFHPEAARAAEIREVQQELPAEIPAPGDPPWSGDKPS